MPCDVTCNVDVTCYNAMYEPMKILKNQMYFERKLVDDDPCVAGAETRWDRTGRATTHSTRGPPFVGSKGSRSGHPRLENHYEL